MIQNEIKFFDHGYIKLDLNDSENRIISIKCCTPNSLLQAISPVLLGNGILDELMIMNPISAWIPKISSIEIAPIYQKHITIEEINIASKSAVENLLSTFGSFSTVLLHPEMMVPILPMGVYIEFRYRIGIDSIPKILETLESQPIVGVSDFQWGLATVLMRALHDSELQKRLPHQF